VPAGAITKEEFYIDGHCLDWQAIVFNDVYMERDGALLQQKVDDNYTHVVLDLSHVELRHLWKASLH
jgi:hypothetical protein